MLSERRTRFANVSKPAVLLFLSAWVYQSHFTGLNPCHGEFDIDIHTAGMLCFATIDILVSEQLQSSRSEQRKQFSSENV